ncbi:MAG: T9SS type A sorting domain-containing protein [Chitinophagales bacterium]|nr:T9SS type A sorting domain-containing protein [Chitinophagales bacterium]
MKKISLLILGLSALFMAHAQSFNWAAAKNISCCSGINGMAIDNTGNIYVGGIFYGDNYVGPNYITSTTPFKYNSFVSKSNRNGKVLWVKTIGSNESSTVQRIAADNSGNIFLTGFYRTDLVYEGDTLHSSGQNDAFIMKIDNAGTLLWWDHTIGTGSEFFYDVDVNDDGDAYVCGKFAGSMHVQEAYYFVSPESVTDMCVIKFDGATGELIWARQSNSSLGNNSSGSRIAADHSGNVYVLGNYSGNTTFGDYTLTGTFNDYFISKLDDASNFTYTNDVGDIPNGYVCNIDVDGSDNTYIAGNFGFFSPFTATISGSTITSPGNSEIFIAKYNPDFVMQWLETGGGTTSGDFSNDLAVTNDGDIYVACTSGSSVTFGTVSATSSHPGFNDITVVKYDNTGTEQWASVSGGVDYDAVSCIDICEPGHYAAIAGIGGSNMFFGLKKVKKSNLYIARVTDAALRTSGGESLTANFILYPNPASDVLYIDDLPAQTTVQIMQVNGQIMYDETLDGSVEIDVKNMTAGIYFVRIKNAEMQTTQKIIIQ